MKTFTEKEVEKIVKTAVSTTIEAMMKYITEHTEITDIKTGKILKNAVIGISNKNHKKPAEIILPMLEEKGIKYEFKKLN